MNEFPPSHNTYHVGVISCLDSVLCSSVQPYEALTPRVAAPSGQSPNAVGVLVCVEAGGQGGKEVAKLVVVVHNRSRNGRTCMEAGISSRSEIRAESCQTCLPKGTTDTTY